MGAGCRVQAAGRQGVWPRGNPNPPCGQYSLRGTRRAVAGLNGGRGPGTHGTAVFLQSLSRLTRNAEENGTPDTFPTGH